MSKHGDHFRKLSLKYSDFGTFFPPKSYVGATLIFFVLPSDENWPTNVGLSHFNFKNLMLRHQNAPIWSIALLLLPRL